MGTTMPNTPFRPNVESPNKPRCYNKVPKQQWISGIRPGRSFAIWGLIASFGNSPHLATQNPIILATPQVVCGDLSADPKPDDSRRRQNEVAHEWGRDLG